MEIDVRYNTRQYTGFFPVVDTMWTPNCTRFAMPTYEKKPLTKTAIDQAAAKSRRYHLWDGVIAGFGVRIEASGRKTFVLRYRSNGGGRTAPRRFMTIGAYGVLTVVEARKQAQRLLGAVALGEDPAHDRQAERKQIRMCDLIDLYEEKGCYIQRGRRRGQPMKEKTRRYTISRLRNHVVPLLGNKRIGSVDALAIEKFFWQVANGKSAKNTKLGPRRRSVVRGGEGVARKAVRDLSAVFSFAIHRQLVDDNPVMKAAVCKTDNQRDRYLTLEEISRLGDAFDQLLSEGINPMAIDIAKLWTLTGCRRNEIAALRWDEVDLENGLLRLDDTKTGKSIRPLCAAAASIIKNTKRDPQSEYVFPATSGPGFFRGMKGVWKKVQRIADLPDVTPHTLRHTVASTAVSNGEGLALTGALLGHSNPRSTAIYAHVQNQPMKQAAERVGATIAAALEANRAETSVPEVSAPKELPARANDH